MSLNSFFDSLDTDTDAQFDVWKKTITQKEFLEKMGIIQRAESIARNMKFREQSNLYLRLKRLLSPQYMGDLFKVILAYNFNNSNFAGFK